MEKGAGSCTHPAPDNVGKFPDSTHKKKNYFSLCCSGNDEGLHGSRDFADIGDQETAIKTPSRFCCNTY